VNGIKNDIDTKTAAERWGVTAGTVAKYCAAGFIPGALKTGRVWRIPYGSIKPLNLDNMIKLLRLVNTLKHYPDFSVDYDSAGLSDMNISKVFEYLVATGMVQRFDALTEAGRIPYVAKLTQRGLDLVTNNRKTKISIDNELILKAGLAIIAEVAAAIIKAAS